MALRFPRPGYKYAYTQNNEIHRAVITCNSKVHATSECRKIPSVILQQKPTAGLHQLPEAVHCEQILAQHHVKLRGEQCRSMPCFKYCSYYCLRILCCIVTVQITPLTVPNFRAYLLARGTGPLPPVSYGVDMREWADSPTEEEVLRVRAAGAKNAGEPRVGLCH